MILHHLILFKFICSFISIQCLSEVDWRPSKIIRAPAGLIQGLILKTVLKQMEYSSFRGIPYAEPPVGNLRFKPPVKLDQQVRGINPGYPAFPAEQDANMCPQFDVENDVVLGNEDCLYLNVYTPEVEFKKGHEKRAVMVWIHGGAFMWGSNNSSYFGPDFLIEKNVVLVAMNYRLGAFGFFAAGNLIDGNMGLKDQVMALEWVQDNIVHFGGDPKKVTIFGESAGAVSVELHRISLLSQGLFRASIAMSGSPLNPWAFADRDHAETMSAELIKLWDEDLGITRVKDPLSVSEILVEHAKEYLRDLLMDDPTAIRKFKSLMNKRTDKIVRTTYYLARLQIRIPFVPTTENLIISKAIITRMPETFYNNGFFSIVPHMMGYTYNEFIGIAPIFQSMYEALYGLQTVIESLASEKFFEEGIDQTRKYFDRHSRPVWQYINAFDYPQSLHKVAGLDESECGHADDIAHIFYVKNKNQPIDNTSLISLHRDKMTTLWTNFAKYLHPEPKSPNRWQPISMGQRLVLDDPNIYKQEPLPS